MVHRGERPPQHADRVQRVGIEQFLLTPRPRLRDVDRGPDPPVRKLAVEHQFHVSRTLELLENEFVHPAAGVDQGRRHDRQRPPFLEHAGRGEQLLGDVERLDIDTARHRAARVADPLVEGPGHAGDRVHQQEHVLARLGHPLAAFDHQLRQPDVALHVTVEATGHHLSLDGPAHVSDFLGTLVNEQHHELKIGMIGRDRLRYLLQEHGLAGARRCHDQRPLPLAKRRQQIHHAGRDRLLAGFKTQPRLRIDRRELIEGLDAGILVGRQPLHFLNFTDPWPLLPSSWLHEGLDRHAFAQPIPLDHRGGDERISPLTLVVGFRAPQEPVSVGVHLQDAVARLEGNRFTRFGDLRLKVRRPHPVPFHINRAGPGRHRAAATTAAAATKPPTTTAVTSSAATMRRPLTSAGVTARRVPALPTWAALPTLSALSAKPTAAPRSPPLRHGYSTPLDERIRQHSLEPSREPATKPPAERDQSGSDHRTDRTNETHKNQILKPVPETRPWGFTPSGSNSRISARM